MGVGAIASPGDGPAYIMLIIEDTPVHMNVAMPADLCDNQFKLTVADSQKLQTILALIDVSMFKFTILRLDFELVKATGQQRRDF